MTPYHGSSKKDAEARIAGLSELIPPAVGIQHLVHSVKHPFTVEDLDKPMPLLEADVIGAGSPRKLVNEYVRRSEEHTSELQSLMRISYAVFFLKKKISFIV